MEETPQAVAEKSKDSSKKKTTSATDSIALLPYLIRYFKGSGIIILVWFLGYFGFSVSWALIGLFMFMLNKEYQKIRTKQLAFSRAAVSDEQAAILARTDELPSWVYFPDVERAEWLNKIIKQMWPYVGEYVKGILKNSVQASIHNSLPKSLQPFKFQKIDLGDVPPRIGGVKVYIENVKRDEIILDTELFFASDSEIKCDVRGISAGIKSLTIHGNLRIVMCPLVNITPIIGGMNVFFLSPPSVDFDLTNTANILDLPVLSNSLRQVISDQLSYYMVLPNKLPIQLIENLDVNRFKFPPPAGVVRLHVIAGRDLKRADIGLMGKGKSDPYCKLYVGADVMKTKTVKDSVNPVWNQYFESVLEAQQGQFVEIDCLDEDPGDDDELGSASVDLEKVVETGSYDSWLPLENVSTGMIHVRAMWLHLSKNPADLEKEYRLRTQRIRTLVEQFSRDWFSTAPAYCRDIYPSGDKIQDKVLSQAVQQKAKGMVTEEHLSGAILMVFLDSAKNLPRSKKSLSEPSPRVKMTVGNKEVKSAAKEKTTDPRWEERFQFLIHDPRHQDLSLEIHDTNKDKKRIATLNVLLKNLMQAPDMTMYRPFELKDAGPKSQITLRLCLRILTSQLPEEWARDTPVVPAASTPVVDQKSTTPETKVDENKNLPSAASEIPAKNTTQADATAAAQKTPAQPPSPAGTQQMPSHVGNGGAIDDEADFDTRDLMMDSEAPVDTSSVRHRSAPKPTTSLGRIQLTVRHSVQRNKLVVVVHKCLNLRGCDEENMSDPYVKIYLLPDKSGTKRKTPVIKNNLNPIFDDTFDWTMTMQQASTQTVEITVKNDTGVFSREKTVIGQVLIDLSEIDLSKPTTEWFDLMPGEE